MEARRQAEEKLPLAAAAGHMPAPQVAGFRRQLPSAVAPAQPRRPSADILYGMQNRQLPEPMSGQIQLFS